MSSLGAPRRPSDPAGGGDNNRADTATQSACERNLEWVGKRVNGKATARFPTLNSLFPLPCSHSKEWARYDTALVLTLKSGPSETLPLVPTLKSGPNKTLRLSAVQCRAHASGGGKRGRRGRQGRCPNPKRGPGAKLALKGAEGRGAAY